jgi:hypothetical protein
LLAKAARESGHVVAGDAGGFNDSFEGQRVEQPGEITAVGSQGVRRAAALDREMPQVAIELLGQVRRWLVTHGGHAP